MAQERDKKSVKNNEAGSYADKVQKLIQQNQSAYSQSLENYQREQSGRFLPIGPSLKRRHTG